MKTGGFDYGRKLWLSYIMILVLPLAGLFFAYQTSVRLIERQTLQSNLNMLEYSRDMLESRLSEMDRLGAQLMMNTKVNALLRFNRKLADREIYRLREAWLDISHYPIANSYLTYFFIVLRGSDVVLAAEAPYIGAEQFYRNFFQYGGLDYGQWQRLLFDARHRRRWLPAVDTRIAGRAARTLAYVQSMPPDAINTPDGVMVLLMEERHIQDMLKRLQIQEGGWAGVFDGAGALMTSVGAAPELDGFTFGGAQGYYETNVGGASALVSYARSGVNGWLYVSAVPTRVLMEQVDWLRGLLRGAAAVTMLAGLALAAFAVYSNARPVREQEPLLRQSFFDRLFAGDFHSEEEINAYLRHVNVPLSAKRYAVLLVRLLGFGHEITPQTLDALSVRRVATRTAAEQAGFICHNVGMDGVAVIISLSGGSDPREYAQRLLSGLRAHALSDMDFSISGGEPCAGLLGIHTSYLQAKRAMHFASSIIIDCANQPPSSMRNIAWHSELPQNEEIYDFPLRLETKLSHLVMAGNAEETAALLAQAYRQNFVERHISLDMARHYINEVFNTAVKIIGQLPGKTDALKRAASEIDAHMRADIPLDEIHRMTTVLYDSLCRAAQEAKRGRSGGLAHDMLQFVEAHSPQETFNLAAVAEAFDLTDSYVSEYFKEHTGENFSAYLERIRLDRACELLTSGGTPINQIASEIGYGNDNTFRRAFKRRFGVSPSDYRDSSSQEKP